jgi:2TM domain
MPRRTRSTRQRLQFSEPPMRGFLIHLTIYVVVIAGLTAFNLVTDPANPWFVWVLAGWGIGLAVHDLMLLMKSR